MSQISIDQAVQLALAHHRANRFDDAERLYRQILSRQPNHPDTLHLLGRLALQTERGEEGLDLIRRAIGVVPGSAELHMALGNGLSDVGRFDEAVAAFGRAVQLNASYYDAWNNLGQALTDVSRFDESLAAYARAIRLKPDLAEAHKGAGIVLLLKGNYDQGFREYEWRWREAGFNAPRRTFSQPRWNGEALNGRTILLEAEQGFGDTIQFVRYAPLVASRGGRVVVGCPADVAALIANMPDVKEVISDGPLPPFDVHCPMMSLPLAFNTRVETIPGACPYLCADSNRAEAWRKKLAPFSGRLKAGLVWAGRMDQGDDRRRSTRLSMLAPLAKTPGVTFFSLQKGPAAAQSASPPAGMKLIDLTCDLTDFSETAALISHLDVVITVCTSIAHLAGAMGKPVWLMLAYRPDWRWMLNREDSPWYPTVRLFRQKSPGDWAGVVRRVGQALGSL